jgi:hypothetical protein
MPKRCEDNFGCIESAQEFLALLTEAITETKRDVDADMQQLVPTGGSRRTEVLRIASYDLEVLEHHLRRSKRIMNDLRMMRRLLLAQRGVPEEKLPKVPAPIPPVRMEIPIPPEHLARQGRRPEQKMMREELVGVTAA